MLRAMDCKHDVPAKNWLTCTAIVTIASFGLATTALRSFAEGEKEQKPSTKPANAKTIEATDFGDGIHTNFGNTIIRNSGGIITTTSSEGDLSIGTVVGNLNVSGISINTTAAPLFQRDKVTAAHPAFTKHGAFYLNCAAARKTALWPVIKSFLSVEEAQSAWLKNCDWNGLDSLISNFILTVTPKTSTEKGKVMFGAGYVRVNTNYDVDWHHAIHTVTKDPVDGTKDGVNYIDGIISAMGSSKVRFVPVGPRELATLISVKHDKADPTRMVPVDLNLAQWLNPKPEDLQHSWNEEWNAAGGGIVTALFSIPDVNGFFEDDAKVENKDALEIVEMLRKIDVVSVGLDIQNTAFGVNIQNSPNLLNVRVRLRCIDSAKPEEMLKAVQKYIDLGKDTKWNADDPNRSPSDDVFSKLLAEAYSKTSLKVIHGTQNVIECTTTFELSPELLASLATDPTDKKVTPASNETSK